MYLFKKKRALECGCHDCLLLKQRLINASTTYYPNYKEDNHHHCQKNCNTLKLFFFFFKTKAVNPRVPLKNWTSLARQGSIKQSSSTCSTDYYDIQKQNRI